MLEVLKLPCDCTDIDITTEALILDIDQISQTDSSYLSKNVLEKHFFSCNCCWMLHQTLIPWQWKEDLIKINEPKTENKTMNSRKKFFMLVYEWTREPDLLNILSVTTAQAPSFLDQCAASLSIVINCSLFNCSFCCEENLCNPAGPACTQSPDSRSCFCVVTSF